MRLDKFLKISRLVKRRSVAKEFADQGRVMINGRSGKAASDVAEGDLLTLRFGQKQTTVRITALKETVKKEEAGSLYEIVDARQD
ncbi:MAG: RNA-binding S4 domain-containing protein [Sporolactobacillus sp.]|jgi:ribosomal 50S subunit-recycling heat shock protein|nr:RNA-binding S4 domain-containing protein [Sporolactobacillus sp.]MCI1880997.1 RNA-binding S4 domain-containing protein [Sporolactobacillus sp.]